MEKKKLDKLKTTWTKSIAKYSLILMVDKCIGNKISNFFL